MKRVAFVVVAVLVLCAVPLIASAEIPGNYVAIKLGGYFPQSSDLENFSNGFNGEIGFGHRFSPMFSGELGIGYFQTDDESSGVAPVIGTFTEKDEITVIPVTVTGKIMFPTGSNGEIFGGAGIGIYLAKGEADISTSGLGSASLSDKDNVFGFHLLIGGNYNINPNLFVGAEVKYLWADASFTGTALGVPITVDAKLDGIAATASIGFRY